MSKDTLLLSGKPGTGRIAPGKLSPLKPVKAKPELTQQLILKNAEPHTPDIPHWDGDFPFPKNIVYHEERDGKLIADLSMKITPKRWTSPGRTWGEIEAMGGTANAPKFSATVEKAGDFYKLHNAFYQLDIVFRIVDYSSPSWEDGWGKEMERLTGRLGLTLEERKYWAFQHEMDHFTAWSHYFRFMLGHIFQALNAEFASEGLAQTRLKEIQYNSVENF
ncbi:MAG TPA: hypothetical protein PKY05_08450, partial [Fibrobacteria bacterium]|nr:hypothetical protein [Fibrobacteria bacterium]